MNEMIEFFKIILQMQEDGEDLALVTVTASSGSVPRGAGAHMLVGQNGRIFGTIGGGAIEYRVEQEAITALEQKSSPLKSYDLSNNAADLGMVCGGAVTVYIRYLPAEKDNTAEFSTASLCRYAIEELTSNSPLWLILPLDEKPQAVMGFFNPQTGYYPPLFSDPDRELCKLPKGVGIFTKNDRKYYVEQLSSSSCVHIFGGGHIARKLVPLLSSTGFTCVVYDDREDFLIREDFPDAAALIRVDFDNPEGALMEAQENYFVIMTRGHKHDTQIQAYAMKTAADYIGVMGSRKKKAYVFEELRKQGFTDEELDRIHTPIGLSINAETPAEIAVSIAAELIQVRNGFRKIGAHL